jgi:ABC-2 type transport system permease protein
MRKHRLREATNGILTILIYRMKLIGKDKATRIILLASVLLFAWMVFSLSVSAGDQSSLPVGIVDNDVSQSSMDLITRLENSASLKVIIGSEKVLNKKLLDEMIISYFVIDNGYEKKIKAGDLDGIITAYFKSDNKAASIISDIVAGEMMYPVCYYKALNLYKQIDFEGVKHTDARYSDYISSLLRNSKDFDFAFHMNYINPGKSEVSGEALDNSVLYQQLVFGILGILNAFISMFVLSQTVTEKENGVEIRLGRKAWRLQS